MGYYDSTTALGGRAAPQYDVSSLLQSVENLRKVSAAPRDREVELYKFELAAKEREDRLAQQAVDNKRAETLLKIQTDKAAKDELSDARLGELYTADQGSKVAIGNTNSAYEDLAGRAGSMKDAEYNAELAKLNDKAILDTGAFVGGRGLLTPEFIKGVDPKALIGYTTTLDTIKREEDKDKQDYLRRQQEADKNIETQKELAKFKHSLDVDLSDRKYRQDKVLTGMKLTSESGGVSSKDAKEQLGVADLQAAIEANGGKIPEVVYKDSSGKPLVGGDGKPLTAKKIYDKDTLSKILSDTIAQRSKVEEGISGALSKVSDPFFGSYSKKYLPREEVLTRVNNKLSLYPKAASEINRGLPALIDEDGNVQTSKLNSFLKEIDDKYKAK